MRTTLALATIAVLATFLGCASSSVHVDYDPEANFATYTTWHWVPGDPAISNPVTTKRIREAIANNLKAKGYTRSNSPDNATMLVAFSGYTEDKVDVWRTDYHRGWRRGRRTVVTKYTEGTLIVDIVDGQSRELVWRGSGSGVLGKPGDDERVARSIGKILASFPPEEK